ncbi:hypothetical protein DEU56DRAFT_757695 [Suillus clintonianus]|uniref:uncharacterized protein n=1 Tax=Suillus clintonianus TaxID=1904413 RepID=UPI001B87614A|nr:uncharacterized protein DEU56DRAFT_757695 [Suillus clintonianus]KAG2131070.1 hypothetical protein DEU56DRAFT_757695 [Suillus clintonianus]
MVNREEVKPCAASSVASTLLVSLGLTEADAADAAPRRSGRSNAGTGGRNAQLEKIGVVLEAKSQNRKPKGATSLGTLNPVNPQAPEPPCKGQKRHPKGNDISFNTDDISLYALHIWDTFYI